VSGGAAPGYGPKECGSCRLWRPILEDGRGPIGPCRLEVRTGNFPGTAPTCERYLSREEAVPQAPPPEPTRRRSPRARPPDVRRAEEAPGSPPLAAPKPLPEEVLDMTREEFAQAIREALSETGAAVHLAPRWEGGTLVLKPGDADTQPKEIPLDSLFHKIVMIRDRLRAREALRCREGGDAAVRHPLLWLAYHLQPALPGRARPLRGRQGVGPVKGRPAAAARLARRAALVILGGTWT